MNGIPKIFGRVVWPQQGLPMEGVTEEALVYIKRAIEFDHVEFVSHEEANDRKRVQFDYLGFRYEIDCRYMPGDRPLLQVIEIEKIAKVSPAEEVEGYEPPEWHITMSDNVIVENYRLQRQPEEFGSW